MRAPLYAGAVAKLVRQRTANPRSPVRVRAAPLKTRSPYGAPRSLGLGASCVLEGRERRRPDARARRALAGTPKADPRTAGSSRAATLPSKTTTVIRETSEDRPQGDRSSIRAAPLGVPSGPQVSLTCGPHSFPGVPGAARTGTAAGRTRASPQARPRNAGSTRGTGPVSKIFTPIPENIEDRPAGPCRSAPNVWCRHESGRGRAYPHGRVE